MRGDGSDDVEADGSCCTAAAEPLDSAASALALGCDAVKSTLLKFASDPDSVGASERVSASGCVGASPSWSCSSSWPVKALLGCSSWARFGVPGSSLSTTEAAEHSSCDIS